MRAYAGTPSVLPHQVPCGGWKFSLRVFAQAYSKIVGPSKRGEWKPQAGCPFSDSSSLSRPQRTVLEGSTRGQANLRARNALAHPKGPQETKQKEISIQHCQQTIETWVYSFVSSTLSCSLCNSLRKGWGYRLAGRALPQRTHSLRFDSHSTA